MSIFSTTTTAVAAKQTAEAKRQVAAYRAEGFGSNRTDWVRMESLLAAVLQVVATGIPVDVSDLFPAVGEASPYHAAHRALKPALFTPYWPKVQVVALRKVTRNGKVVEGESSTTKGTTVLICPVA